MSKVVELRVEPPEAALDRFEQAWLAVEEGAALAPRAILSLPDLPALAKTLSPARWALLEQLRRDGPLAVYALAKRLGRDYKNVHTDVAQLAALGLVSRDSGGRVAVPWDTLRAELRLGG